MCSNNHLQVKCEFIKLHILWVFMLNNQWDSIYIFHIICRNISRALIFKQSSKVFLSFLFIFKIGCWMSSNICVKIDLDHCLKLLLYRYYKIDNSNHWTKMHFYFKMLYMCAENNIFFKMLYMCWVSVVFM